MVLSAYSHGGTKVLYPDVNIRGTRGSPTPLPVGVPGALNGGWDMGKPGFPTPLPVGRSPVPAPSGGFPTPLPVGVPGALNGGWDMGKPGFPTPFPEARAWDGAAFPPLPGRRGRAAPAGRGVGKPGFPTFHPCRGGEGVPPRQTGVWGNLVSPRFTPV